MATVSDITTTPVSGMNHIDAMLDIGPDWNFLTGNAANTIYYTFSILSGNEADRSGQQSFSASQQVATRTAFSYLAEITGIKFVETAVGTNAQIHLANVNLEGSTTTGLCSWNAPYSYSSGNVLVDYKPNAYVYLDNVEWNAQNQNLTPGSEGYETLLHELGHALGLKHPFEDDIRLPSSLDNTSYTLMSYNRVGGPHSTFSPYDIAALDWLYGRDGLGGALGIGSTNKAIYLTGTDGAETLTGTAFDDTLQGNGGNDVINGGNGNDTAVFMGARGNYSFTNNADGSLTVASALEGVDTLVAIEQLRFAGNVTVARANVVDTTPPTVPVFTVAKNGQGYLSTGNTPVVSGQAEANAIVRIYNGNQLIGEGRSDEKTGIFSIVTNAFADGRGYSLQVTATDAAGNVSPFSAPVSFHVDSTPPATPTSSFALAANGNQPVFEGKAEAGTTLQLVADAAEVGRTTVSADGTWKIASAPLPNGTYKWLASSFDIADNAASAGAYLDFTINSALNQAGNASNNSFTLGAGNNAVDGMGGIDTVVYAGARADYTVARGLWGTTVTAKGGSEGTDGLYNVERLKFSDGWKAIDIDGVAGQVYRLYESVLGRPAEAAGQGYWMWRMESTGASLLQVAEEFMKQPEFATLYGANPTEAQFVRQLYLNILNREPDAAGYEYWLDVINDTNRADVIVGFSEGFENMAQVIEVIGSGINYTPWTQA